LTQFENQSLAKLKSGSVLAGGFVKKTFSVDAGLLTFSSLGSRLTAVSFRQFQKANSEVYTFIPLGLRVGSKIEGRSSDKGLTGAELCCKNSSKLDLFKLLARRPQILLIERNF
jgi:hypothetical protein